MSIILGVLNSILNAASWAFWKKSFNNSLPNLLFLMLWDIIAIFFVIVLIFLLWVNFNIFLNPYAILLLIIVWVLDTIGALLEIKILKKVKLSQVLPYGSFDKLFVIIFWFLLFYWKVWYTSFATLFISILTVFIIILFSIDIKKFKLDIFVLQYIFVKFIYAISTLIIWKILLEYSSVDILTILVLAYFIIVFILNLLFKNKFKLLLKENKKFYKYRFLSSITWWLCIWIWFFIIKTSWVLVASLLSFVTIVFSIFSMKFLLWDNPTKKQVILAALVVILIWLWFYFK